MLTGKMYTIEFLVGHETRCYENFRMKKDVFMNFCETLKEVGNLCDGKKVNIEEAVAMFLIIICHNLCHRVVAERFQHSLRHRVPNYPKSSFINNFISLYFSSEVSIMLKSL